MLYVWDMDKNIGGKMEDQEKKENYILKDMVLEIDFNGKKEKILMREPKFGAQNQAIRKAIGVGGRADEVLGREMIALECIQEAPFPKTLEALRELPASIGNKIVENAMKLTTFEEELKKKLDSQSGMTNIQKTQN